ncbi:MAG: hypothetical protein ACREUV_04940 [Burkholderiales bacterium]
MLTGNEIEALMEDRQSTLLTAHDKTILIRDRMLLDEILRLCGVDEALRFYTASGE